MPTLRLPHPDRRKLTTLVAPRTGPHPAGAQPPAETLAIAGTAPVLQNPLRTKLTRVPDPLELARKRTARPMDREGKGPDPNRPQRLPPLPRMAEHDPLAGLLPGRRTARQPRRSARVPRPRPGQGRGGPVRRGSRRPPGTTGLGDHGSNASSRPYDASGNCGGRTTPPAEDRNPTGESANTHTAG